MYYCNDNTLFISNELHRDGFALEVDTVTDEIFLRV